MNTLEVIEARKSVRSFTTQAVEKEKLEQIAKAGSFGAAGMAKPVYVTMVTNAETIQKLNAATKQVMVNSGNDFLVKMAGNPDYNPLYEATALAIVSANTESEPFAINNNTANCACAGQNMLLAATELGIASCFATSPTLGFMVPGMKSTLGIAEDHTVSAVVLLGYSDDKTPSEKHINAGNVSFVE